ncbi:sterile alpha motif domain-containing protein 3-like [Tachypleus tridentatus]|uniref:sterile alpha motif domain-containing protein 3-like n=1 Tax=Tachypleus tridentatus TaxID=6853 RepID=UPI003FD50D04
MEKKIVVSVDGLGLFPSKISDNLNLDVDATNFSVQVYMEDWQDWVDVQCILAFKPWTVPSQRDNLSSLPRSTALLLSQGKPVEKEGRFHLLDAICTEVSNYTLYPTSKQYDQVVDETFKRNPQLSDVPNLTPQGVCELWRMRLRQKFQNNRKRKDSSLSIVQERKKKTKTATDETPFPNYISEQRLYGLKQHLCEKPVGEDETSTEKHKQWMKTRLHCRKKGDLCKVDLLMDKTLHDRRKLTIYNTPVNELIEHYPFFVASPPQLSNEFKRLRNDAEKKCPTFSI